MDKKINEVIKYLNLKYSPSLIVVYGSFCTNTMNDESDIDLLVFANVEKSSHDSNTISGHVLDAWIYPENEIEKIDKYIHIIPCQILKDDNEKGLEFIEKIKDKRNNTNCIMSEKESSHLKAWITKMINRSKGDSIESNYRYNWLLNDFPELYCKFNKLYYNGPIKTLNFIKNENKEIYEVYKQLLSSGKDIENLKKIYCMI